MKTSRKLMTLVLSCLMVVGLLVGCGGSKGDTIKLGWMGSLTGEQAAYGICESQTLKMMVEEKNAAGGIMPPGRRAASTSTERFVSPTSASAHPSSVHASTARFVLTKNSMNGGAANAPESQATQSSTEFEDGSIWESQKSDAPERTSPPRWRLSIWGVAVPADVHATGETPVVPARFATVVVNPRANASNARPVDETRRRRTQTRTNRSCAATSRQRTAAEESAHTTTNDSTSRIASTIITEILPAARLWRRRPCPACRRQERGHRRPVRRREFWYRQYRPSCLRQRQPRRRR